MFLVTNSTNLSLSHAPSTNGVSTIEIIIVILISLPTLIGNKLILYTYFKNYKMRTVTNTIVINMCIVDIISVMADVCFLLVQLLYQELLHQVVFCRISIFINRCLTNIVLMSMVAISVDRYIHLVQNSLRRPRRQHLIIILSYAWFHAFLTSLPWDLLVDSSSSTHVALNVCRRFPQPYLDLPSMHTMSYIIKTVGFLLPYAGIIWVAVQVGLSTRKRRAIHIQDTGLSPQSAAKTERFALHSYGRSIVTVFLLFSSFIGFTLPFLGTVTWAIFAGKTTFPPSIDSMVFFLFRLQGVSLPIVYLTRNRFIFDFLRRRCFCCKLDRIREKRSQILQPSLNYKQRRAFLVNKSSIKRAKQLNRYKIFYTSGAQKELSAVFTDIGTDNYKDNLVQSIESQVIVVKEATLAGDLQQKGNLAFTDLGSINSDENSTEING